MRVGGGVYKNTQLFSVTDPSDVRPTPAMMRLAAMDICRPFIHGAVVWDMFSGSGAMGVEFASAGASKVVFFERSSPALLAIKKNVGLVLSRSLPHTTQPPAFQILDRDAFAPPPKSLWPPQILWCDPPFSHSLRWLRKLPPRKLLTASGGHFLMKISARQKVEGARILENHEDGLQVKTKTYGSTSLLYCEWNPEAP